jgi:hypothetical protein
LRKSKRGRCRVTHVDEGGRTSRLERTPDPAEQGEREPRGGQLVLEAHAAP